MKRTTPRIGSWKLSKPIALSVAGAVEEFLWNEVIISDTYGLGGLAESGFQPGVVWDVGASVGYFSAAAHAIWPVASVWAWEPFPTAAGCARSNAPQANVRLAAAGCQAGQCGLLQWDEPVGHAGSMLESLAFGDRDKREGVSIREVVSVEAPWEVAPAPDLLKLDCEGSEWTLLSALPFQPEVIIGEGHGSDKSSSTIKRRLEEIRPDYDWRIFPWNSQFYGRRRNGIPRFAVKPLTKLP